jgi:hypothetical protein
VSACSTMLSAAPGAHIPEKIPDKKSPAPDTARASRNQHAPARGCESSTAPAGPLKQVAGAKHLTAKIESRRKFVFASRIRRSHNLRGDIVSDVTMRVFEVVR